VLGLERIRPAGRRTTTQRWTPVDVSGLTSGIAPSPPWLPHLRPDDGRGRQVLGWNDSGQLAATHDNRSPDPRGRLGIDQRGRRHHAGGEHTCALTKGGGAKCWGDNSSGQLGDGTTTERLTPGDVSGLTSGIATITAVVTTPAP